MGVRAPARLRRSGAASLVALVALAGPLAAQTAPEGLRAQVESARLGTGYAQMVNLSATPDLSAASYRIDADGPDAKLDLLRLPYESRWLALAPEADLYWKLAAGYLRLRETFSYGPQAGAGGSIASRWSAYSVSGGLVAKVRLGSGVTLEPALDVAVARLDNRASYSGEASALPPLLDGLVFNWNTNAWLATPSLGLAWRTGDADGRASVRGHVARSWIGSFGETDPVQHFNEAANIYSVRAEYAAPTGLHAIGGPLDWVAFGGYAGFFGPNRDVLGFSSVGELGAGLELPVAPDRTASDRWRLSAAYLAGPGVRGWTIDVSLQY